MQIDLSTVLPCSYARAVEEVKTPRLLLHIAHPLVSFKPADETAVPDIWEETTYWFHLKLFGFIPFGKQAVRITYEEAADTLRIRDNGYSRLIRRWDHWITIHNKNGQTLYRDTLDLDAGILTPVVWLFARAFYAHRQRRWIKLAQSGFEY